MQVIVQVAELNNLHTAESPNLTVHARPYLRMNNPGIKNLNEKSSVIPDIRQISPIEMNSVARMLEINNVGSHDVDT